MRKHRKLFYIPGIISLVGIWLFYFYFQKRFTVKQEYIIPLLVPRDQGHNKNEFSENSILAELKNIRGLHIELDGKAESNQKKFGIILYESRKLLYTQDTTTYLDIKLGKECKYAELIRLVDMCRTDGHRTYALIKNRFIIRYYPPEPIDTTKKIEMIYM